MCPSANHRGNRATSKRSGPETLAGPLRAWMLPRSGQKAHAMQTKQIAGVGGSPRGTFRALPVQAYFHPWRSQVAANARLLLFRLPLCLRFTHLLCMFCALRERGPGSFRSATTFAYMIERCRVRIGTRLCGARAKELEARASYHLAAHLYSGWLSVASSGWPASSADLRFTALILPRLSC